jgi:perosamine synthetase
LSRNQVMQDLLLHGVSTRRGIMNAHQEAAYADVYHARLPHSEAARDAVIMLPLYNGMPASAQDLIIDRLRGLARMPEAS